MSVTPLSSNQREQAITNLVKYTRAGDLAALRDLIELVRAWHLHNDARIAEVLADVLLSSNCSSAQRALVESLRENPMYLLVEKEQRAKAIGNLVEAAKAGDPRALRDLIRLAESERANNDVRIAQTLANVFLADSSSRDTKALIWFLRDRRVYRCEWEEEVDSWRTEQYGDEVGEVYDGKTTIARVEHYTFLEYLKTYHRAQITDLMTKERR